MRRSPLFFLILFPYLLFSQQIKLVKDLTPGFSSKISYHYPYAYSDDKSMFFISEDGLIYRSEGTKGSTVNIKSGKFYDKDEAGIKDGELYFYYDGIFKTSGDSVKRLSTYDVNGNPIALTSCNNEIIYIKNEHPQGQKTLFLLKDDSTHIPLLSFSDYTNFKSINNNIYLSIQRNNSRELWITNGTTEGTRLLTKFGNQERETYISKGIYFDGKIWFQDSYGKVWITDNTPEGTRPFYVSSDTTKYIELSAATKDFIYFIGRSDSLIEFYRYRGVNAIPDTIELPQKYYVPGDTYFNNDAFGANGNYYFIYDIYSHHYFFRINDTGSYPILIKFYDRNVYKHVELIGNFNEKLYFVEHSGQSTASIYRTDGTSKGTIHISTSVTSEPEYDKPFVNFKGDIYHITFDGNYNNLNKIDKNAVETKVGPIGKRFPLSSSPVLLDNLENSMLFYADHALWKTDGRTENTQFIKYLNLTYVLNSSVLNNVLYFTGFHQLNGLQLWRSDGTSDGTYPVKTFDGIKTYNSRFGDLVSYNSRLFIGVNTKEYNYTVFVFDPLKGVFDTLPIPKYKPGSFLITPSGLLFKEYSGEYVAASSHGPPSYPEGKWWRTDGTPAGTGILKELYPTECCYENKKIIISEDKVLLQVNDYKYVDIWKLETEKDRPKLIFRSEVLGFDLLGIVGEEVIFRYANKPGVLKINSKGQLTTISDKIAVYDAGKSVNGKLIFIGTDGSQSGLYVTDGTEKGTYLINNEVKYFYVPSDTIFSFNKNLYFFYNNSIWKTDGTITGSEVVTELPGLRYPYYNFLYRRYNEQYDYYYNDFPAFTFRTVNDNVFFPLFTDNEGYELYVFSCKEDLPEENIPEYVVFPNPTTDFLRIKLPGHYFNCSAKITNTFGKTIWEGKLDGDQLNVEKHASGIYILELDITEQKNKFAFIKH